MKAAAKVGENNWEIITNEGKYTYEPFPPWNGPQLPGPYNWILEQLGPVHESIPQDHNLKPVDEVVGVEGTNYIMGKFLFLYLPVSGLKPTSGLLRASHQDSVQAFLY